MRRPTSLASAVILLALSLATPSAAGCREDVIAIADYAFREAKEGRVELAVTLRSAQAKPIRLIDGKFGLRDSLGGAIGSVPLDRDVALPAGGTLTMTLADSAKGWQRMGKVNQADIVAYACVSGVVYDDGTMDQF